MHTRLRELSKLWFPTEPCAVGWTERAGRFMVATRDIEAGECVLSSLPYSYAAGDEVKEYVCQKCLVERFASGRPCEFSCEGCRQVWYCSADCQQRDALQHGLECLTLKAFLPSVDWEEAGRRTEIRLLCRTLSRRTLEKSDLRAAHPDDAPILNFAEFEQLIAHRQNYSAEVIDYFLSVAAYLKSLAGWPSDMTASEIVETMLRARHNMFNIWGSERLSLGWGVYPRASFFNHSCRPNLSYFRQYKGPEFQFVARRRIRAGEELTVSYLGYGELAERRAFLREHYFFVCACEQCGEEESGLQERGGEEIDERRCPTPGCLGYLAPLREREEARGACPYCSFTAQAVEAGFDRPLGCEPDRLP